MKNIQEIVLDKIGYEEFKKNYYKYFPYSEIVNNSDKIICFDLSYFLEQGYNEYEKTNDKSLFVYYRNLYNFLSEQIAYSIILCQKDGIINNSYVIMDEIEFPTSHFNIAEEQEKISFLGAVHPENAFGTFYKSFILVDFIPFVRRRY